MILYTSSDGNLRWNTTGETVFKSRNITSGSRGIYIHSSDTMYIADMGVVWKLSPNRAVVTAVAGILNSTEPNSTQLSYPQDVYVDRYANTYFYVVDYGNNRVLKFPTNSTSDGNGTLVADVNHSSNKNTSFDQPSGIALSPSLIDNLFITLYGEHSIIRWTSNMSSDIFVAGTSDVPGSHSTLLRNPRGIRIDHNLNIFVADADSQTDIIVAGTDVAGDSSEQLNTPRTVAFDSKMNMYIADSNNK
ncbi:unnamed protein product [Adineta ricciae]|uniref:Uncharacterized protein n=1 Tax=Adineta ricciae TaxID=249248 RepID=A0A815JA48_ADIRI|nr:unnamed protein product [Adineta ricciae]CAF1538174.1 unnamed protein product [Adineta ricciae]